MKNEIAEEKFRQEYLCQFVELPLYKEAFRLWCEFYYSVEEYDRWVCSNSYFNGFEHVAIPTTPKEYKLINDSYRNKKIELLQKKRDAGIEDATFEQARKDAGNVRHEKLRAMLGHSDDRSQNRS